MPVKPITRVSLILKLPGKSLSTKHPCGSLRPVEIDRLKHTIQMYVRGVVVDISVALGELHLYPITLRR